ncbi:hypothetical protein P152DRAFT_199479 [Eremomyces bilateralis CBS 781.70]|uniref:Uncharacterized protein n=1 Tax=Eremomyces bilateralis CBS 781.70 TaxID=1392243 RepID=A0A6G1GDA2_9PEZI|nr:uncharacterized protein P152DRAFT_199479 [Eremomyces bilateralis CBS 781.70]KAF1815849.1 hypothetical protein P152DRAFT_199479 [Eremomyces bilateralis CBS 781.70]
MMLCDWRNSNPHEEDAFTSVSILLGRMLIDHARIDGINFNGCPRSTSKVEVSRQGVTVTSDSVPTLSTCQWSLPNPGSRGLSRPNAAVNGSNAHRISSTTCSSGRAKRTCPSERHDDERRRERFSSGKAWVGSVVSCYSVKAHLHSVRRGVATSDEPRGKGPDRNA